MQFKAVKTVCKAVTAGTLIKAKAKRVKTVNYNV